MDEQSLQLENPLLKILLLEDERSDWFNPIFDEREKCGEFHTLFPVLLEQTSKFFEYYTKEINFSVSTIFFIYSKDDLKMQTRQWCVQHETCPCTSVQHGTTETVSTYLKMQTRQWCVQYETCPCTSVQQGTTETVYTYLKVFVFFFFFFAADVGSVLQCKISAKYWCNVTVALSPTSTLRMEGMVLPKRRSGSYETRELLSHRSVNPLKPELNPICYFLALLAHHFLHVSRIRVKSLTLRLLMSYIYGAPILDVSRSHTTTQHSR